MLIGVGGGSSRNNNDNNSSTNYKVHVQTLTWEEFTADALKSDDELEREEVQPLFNPIYQKDTKRMKALIGTLSEEKRRRFLRTRYAPEGTNKTLTALMLASVLGTGEMVEILRNFCSWRMAPIRTKCAFANRPKRFPHHDHCDAPLGWRNGWPFRSVQSVGQTRGRHRRGRAAIWHLTTMAACNNNARLDTVDLLIKNGANVHHGDPAGATALMWASNVGLKDIVKRLLKAGARADQANKKGVTAIDIAARKGHVEIVKILRDAALHNEL
ncbi:hypothetical protein niasHS_009898 [Heterodera schachtii]|uniref:Uncharacterized protein n=1 Tax=Heterodera schachtii TaxID=97005 RepID=A0ABD2JD56_HETSC